MNLQTELSGQISGKVLNQVGIPVSGILQQNGNPVPGPTENPIMLGSVPIMEHERRYMQHEILKFLMERRQQSHEPPSNKIVDLVKRLELGLLKSSRTKEEYLNLATLGSRLQFLIKCYSMSNHNQQQFQHVNSSASIGTMIPTPGFQQPANSSLTQTSSVDGSLAITHISNKIASSTINSGSFLPTGNGASGNMHGALASGYQQSSFSANREGNNTIASMGSQRLTSQMIPTPGFINSNDANNNSNNQSFMNIESSNNDGAAAAVKSTVVSQPMRHMQHGGGQNSRILRNLGGPMGGGIRSTLQQNSSGLPNGSLNGGLGIIGNNMSMMNDPETTEGYLNETMYRNSPRSLNRHYEHQQSVKQGDRYGIATAVASGPRNSFVPMTPVGSMTHNECSSAVSMPKTNSIQSTVDTTQQVRTAKPQSIDHSDKMSIQSQCSVRENLVQTHRSQHEQPVQHKAQQNQQVENQLWLNEDTFSQSEMSPSIVFESKSRPGTEYSIEGLQSQVSEPCQFSDMQSQFKQNSTDDHSRSTQLLACESGQQVVRSSRTQTSDQMQQLLHLQQFEANRQNNIDGLSSITQRDAALRDQWHSKSQGVSHVSSRHLLDQNVQNELHHRLTGKAVAQPNNLASEESVISRSDASRSTELPNTSNGGRSNNNNNNNCNNNNNREKQFKNQQRWLLLLRHARRCPSREGKCLEHCLMVQKLLKHMEHCEESHCAHPRCHWSKALIHHHRTCLDANCPVCIPVKNFVRALQLKTSSFSDFNSELPGLINGSCTSHDTFEIAGRSMPKTSPLLAETLEDLQPSVKRIKIEQGSQSLFSKSECSGALVSAINEPPPQEALHAEQHHESHFAKKSEITEVKMEVSESVGHSSPNIFEIKMDNLDSAYVHKPEADSFASPNPSGFGVQEVIKNEKEMGQAESKNTLVPSENASKSGKPKIKGVSMMELFTPEQVRQHITGLRQWVGQSKAKAERNQAMEHSMGENSCQLCAVERLTFEPPPLYCTSCGARIKRNAMYYTIGSGETRYYFCMPCYSEARGDTMRVDGVTIAKTRMEKKKNDEDAEESWVQCDKCEAWQHQICTLFNARRNDCGQAEYTCPNCYITEVERGERVPLEQSAVLGAEDLPRTILSNHLEQRLFAKLKQERQDRARIQGKSYDEVPGAESLVVRVVSSVDKKLEVKPRFLEIFREENYPTEFPYKSKVVLLFQKIEGVEVCLFGMYLQEFGSECQQPNHRRVYLSYLDSVKYFRPEVKTVTGEALRTFVYHEILIGYLEYCKQRGFTSCYIWACPPLKGEDYILYCHPEIQKTPRSDKLREWYLSMLRKATKENIVVELTNLYDHFFVSNGECKTKVTASRLPYFDGDYWPGAAEDMIFQLQEEEDGRKQPKKGAMKKTISKRALKASGHLDLSGNAAKDLMLMHKIGETISPMKEDFIMVHLQHSCKHCCILMVSGRNWFCRQCRNFQLCDKCYEAERKREDRERHPINQKDKHSLYPVEINGVNEDTKDKDEILESEFFDTRHAFLNLCQGNHYQYDTLRRAKHSSMMVLYHLHNPSAPAFVAMCNICRLDMETGQGWRCPTCSEYDVCNACYKKEGASVHPHKLINYSSNAQNTEARAKRVSELKKMLELLVHAARCLFRQCQYPNCRKVKQLFRHGIACKVRAAGGCILCKRMWNLLQLHSRTCKENQCSVPRCRDLKEHVRRLQHQAESRRRAAVNEMARQRAAEAADD